LSTDRIVCFQHETCILNVGLALNIISQINWAMEQLSATITICLRSKGSNIWY